MKTTILMLLCVGSCGVDPVGLPSDEPAPIAPAESAAQGPQERRPSEVQAQGVPLGSGGAVQAPTAQGGAIQAPSGQGGGLATLGQGGAVQAPVGQDAGSGPNVIPSTDGPPPPKDLGFFVKCPTGSPSTKWDAGCADKNYIDAKFVWKTPRIDVSWYWFPGADPVTVTVARLGQDNSYQRVPERTWTAADCPSGTLLYCSKSFATLPAMNEPYYLEFWDADKKQIWTGRLIPRPADPPTTP